MIRDKIGEWFSYDQTDVKRQAGILCFSSAGTIQCHDMIGLRHHNVLGRRIGNDFLKIAQLDRLIKHHQLFGSFWRDHLAMVAIGKLTPGYLTIWTRCRTQEYPGSR